jgi:hypothetical protein
MQRRGLSNLQIEELRPGLVADNTDIFEALRSDKCKLLALALQQCIGGDCRADAA